MLQGVCHSTTAHDTKEQRQGQHLHSSRSSTSTSSLSHAVPASNLAVSANGAATSMLHMLLLLLVMMRMGWLPMLQQ
jgi:hypothetical protein